MADMHVNKRWNEEEIKVLKEFYPVGGYKLVKEKLPHRKEKSISEKARSLGISSNNKAIFFSSDETRILKEFYPLGGLELVKKHLPNRSDDVIRTKASKLNLKCRQDLYTLEEDEIIRLHYPKYGVKKVTTLLPHRSEQSIQNRAFSLGIKYLTYNKDYFEIIDTQEKSYWLGFMYTDGYVTSNNRWGISLSSKDKDHLQKFLDAFNCNAKIRTRKRKENFGYDNGAIYEESSFLINNSKMHQDLIRNGVIRNKTYSLSFPREKILPRELYSHFIRGLFDGDGTFVFYKYETPRKDRNDKVYERICKEISFVCKSFEFVSKLADILKEECDVDMKINKCNRDDLFIIRVSNKQNMKKLINYLYDDSTTHLDRKFKKSQEILKYCLS